MAGWSTGQPWRVVRSLDRLNGQIRAACPRAVPPATDPRSWGSLADDEHSTSSDHYPHHYAALGPVAVVCARDFPHAPRLGLDAHALAEQLRLSRDPRISYIISRRRITGPAHGWRWDPYSGRDPHDTHIHVSTVHTAAADGTRDWQIGEVTMTEEEMDRLADKVAARAASKVWSAPFGSEDTADVLSAARVEARAARAGVEALATRPPAVVDYDQLADAIVRRVLNPPESA